METTATTANITTATVEGFECGACYDTRTVDFAGAEHACPHCNPIETVKLSKLAHGLGHHFGEYRTAVAGTSSTMTLVGTRSAILNDARRVENEARREARANGFAGRNAHSSWAIALNARIRKALEA